VSFLFLNVTSTHTTYSVWHYRRLCLYALKDDTDLSNGLKAELKWTTLVGGDNPKNYQIWYHRRALLEAYSSQQQQQPEQQPRMKDIGTAELEYIGTVLQVDGKNYHAWSHRQWVVKVLTVNDIRSVGWLAEKEYAAKLLETDVRNNSAWNHRWFAIHGLAAKQNQNNDSDSLVLSLELARDELEFCLAQARLDLHNESPFRYLLALLKEQVEQLQQYDVVQATSLLVEYHDKVANLAEEQEAALVSFTDVASGGLDIDVSSNTTTTTSRFITSTLVDLLEWQGDAASLAQATNLLDDLATNQDPIRCKYWNLRQQRITQQQSSSS
jgi:protein farnesyltransferase/geranylgeranyltransferase type-1 subunit alpha